MKLNFILTMTRSSLEYASHERLSHYLLFLPLRAVA
jgi:hypothetical protein